MKKYLVFAALLLTFTPLAGCTTNERPEWLGGENPRPAADVRPGHRRPPVLQNAPLEAPIPPPPQDYYDSEQKQMAPPPPVPNQQAMNAPKPIRKPFAGDSGYAKEAEVFAPVLPAPGPAASSENKIVVAPPPELAVSPETKAAMAGETKPSEEVKSPSWFSHLGERLGDKPDEQDVEKIKDKPYPKLSDVPEKPTEFDAEKKAKTEKMEELTDEHVAAEEHRDTLSAEPTQATDTKAEPAKVAPKVKKPTPAKKKKSVTPKPKPQPEVKKPAEKEVAKPKPAKKKKPVAPKKKPAVKKEEPTKQSEPDTAKPEATEPDAPKMSFPPGKYDEQLKQEQSLY